MGKLKVLFICRDNSARSQMAAAFLNAYFGDRYQAYSCGVEPSEINPYAKKVMKEIGIDISLSCAKDMAEFRGKEFDCIITLCDYARSRCPLAPGHKKQLHKSFKDYCIPLCCDSAEKSELCFPARTKRRHRDDKRLSDATDNEEKRLAAFRCLREEILDWVEKEAVF